MELLEYSQFGVAIFSIAALVFVIAKFLEFMRHQEDSFKNTIDNHLVTQGKLNQEQMEMNRVLKEAIEQLLAFLRYGQKRE